MKTATNLGWGFQKEGKERVGHEGSQARMKERERGRKKRGNEAATSSAQQQFDPDRSFPKGQG